MSWYDLFERRTAWLHCTVLQGVATIRQSIYCWRGVLRSWRKRKTVLVRCTCQSKETMSTVLGYFYITRLPLTMSPWSVFHFRCIYFIEAEIKWYNYFLDTCANRITFLLRWWWSLMSEGNTLRNQMSSSASVMQRQPIPGISLQQYLSINGSNEWHIWLCFELLSILHLL